MLLTTTLTVHTDLPSYKLRRMEAIAPTSALVVLVRVLKCVLLIAEFITQLQLRSFATETAHSHPLRALPAPLCYMNPLRLKAFCQPPALRGHTLEFGKRGESEDLEVREIRSHFTDPKDGADSADTPWNPN